jgi:hypothetical protein
MSLFPMKLCYLNKVTHRKQVATCYFTETPDEIDNKVDPNNPNLRPIFKCQIDFDSLNRVLAGFGPITVNLLESGYIPYVDLDKGLPFEYRCLKELAEAKVACYVMLNPSTFEVMQVFSAPSQISIDILNILKDVMSGQLYDEYKIAHRLKLAFRTLNAPDDFIDSITMTLLTIVREANIEVTYEDQNKEIVKDSKNDVE